MGMEFRHVFTGKGVRAWKVQCDTGIDDFTAAGMEGTVMGIPRLGRKTNQGLGDFA